MNSLRRLVAGGARTQELRYIAVSLLFLVGGILAVWFVHGVVAVEGDAILVALLVVPLLLYLTLSGKVSELGGGGFTREAQRGAPPARCRRLCRGSRNEREHHPAEEAVPLHET